MVSIRVLRALSPADLAAVRTFLDSAHVLDCAQLNDHLRADLRHGPRPGFLAALATTGDDELIGYAQASAGNEGFVVDAIVWSSFDGDTDLASAALLHRLLDELPDDAAVTWWTHDGDSARELAASLGMRPGRSLLQMRRDLPIDASTDVEVRGFQVGADEQAWLEVNNAAFAWHGEQGGWDLATLQQREREPWFRAEGFLLHERDGELAAFCWTKLHVPDTPDGALVGEIYVIAVHPRFHGLGLGRALTVAGLRSLYAAGATEGMLYVDATNTSAVRLYDQLGFEVAHTDQSYVRPSGGSSQ
ncbi:MAG: mycothiol synthase [Actinobacteria bacterium]|nr:mycothiol synthase [Actinomycetota bacterium]